ncbi:transglutaminase [Bacteroidia bacterium]|nr:transglutaminase [Bacteroidia bacterium]
MKVKLENLSYGEQFESIVAEECQNQREREALSFLFAYMPLCDISDYPSKLYIDAIRTAFKAKEEFRWGKIIPDDVFRHFVLPIRVNNENLDSARTVFYAALRERVKDLPMQEAALEVNHWCHEKVIYTPSDGRTSSPLASVQTGFGRCGEETVFTVAALRAVGIPARQVYTPRWAHTDDNHAWVEVWVDGKWYYLGACEPQPKLNVGWFSSTAQRGMLMHARVFGNYTGEEDIIQKTDCLTEINVTANYAPVERAYVRILNPDGKPVEGALVEFKIYNYAEFYTAISAKTDGKGAVFGTFGKGDLLVWASKDDKYGFRKISVGNETYPVEICLDKSRGDEYVESIDIVPPVASKADIVLTKEEVAENGKRLAVEDSVRNAYLATFASASGSSVVQELTEKLKATPPQCQRIQKAFNLARGNWREICKYLLALSPEQLEQGLDLLDLLREKDFRDTPAEVLLDHVNYLYPEKEKVQTQAAFDAQLWKRYVMRPRVANELLTSWRSFLRSELENVDGITNIIQLAGNVKIFDGYNVQKIPMSAVGVHQLKVADRKSRDIYFVSLCRSVNIPARLEEVTGRLQYYQNGEWIDVNFETPDLVEKKPRGSLNLVYNSDEQGVSDPKFESHFTLADLSELRIHTLNFRNREGIEGTMSLKGRFSKPVDLEQGYYLLTTGTRLASGKVLATLSAFNMKVNEGEMTDVPLLMRKDMADLQVIGNMNVEQQYINANTMKESSILNFTGRGFFVLAFVNVTHEPSNHLVHSILEKDWYLPTLLLYPNQTEAEQFSKLKLPPLPQRVGLGIDKEQRILTAVCEELKLKNFEYPLVIISDSFGRIVFFSEGYNIGMTSLILKYRHQLGMR